MLVITLGPSPAPPLSCSAPSDSLHLLGRMDNLLPESRVTPTSRKGKTFPVHPRLVHSPRAGGAHCVTPCHLIDWHTEATSRFVLDFFSVLCPPVQPFWGEGGPSLRSKTPPKNSGLRFSTCLCPWGPGLGFTSLTGSSPSLPEGHQLWPAGVTPRSRSTASSGKPKDHPGQPQQGSGLDQPWLSI